ncbi:anionic trypsin-like [Chanos chanos]|uniref:Anionic trypsin-like n=1 Tax=Chanos chanos TaxID=29144 RepID=A0A6J2VMY7_CHACN|nr:anionic trypsin-like [Chanos chanos]
MALFELPVTSETGLTTIGLPTNCPAPNTETYRLMGWSSTKKKGSFKNAFKLDIPKHLQCADMKLQAECVPFTATEKQLIKYGQEKVICAKGEHGQKKGKVNAGGAAVSGDSGGSLVYNENGTPVLYGMTVEGHGDPEVESRFMDVCSFTEWIKTTAG